MNTRHHRKATELGITPEAVAQVDRDYFTALRQARQELGLSPLYRNFDAAQLDHMLQIIEARNPDLNRHQIVDILGYNLNKKTRRALGL